MAGTRVTVLAVRLALDVSLADVPVVGSQIPHDTASVSGLDLMVLSSSQTNPAQQQALRSLLDGAGWTGAAWPESVWKATVSVGATLRVTNKPFTAYVALTTSKQTDTMMLSDSAGTDRDDTLLPARQAVLVAAAGTGMTGWVEVDKALGPLRVSRLGVSYRDKTVFLLLDGSLTLGGIVLETMGLGIGVRVESPYTVTATLDGLGIAFEKGPVRIAGEVLRQTPPSPDWDLLLTGGLVVSTSRISMAVVGAYAHGTNGMVSLFLFGEIDGLAIGAPPVEVLGLSGGFGYNSTVTIPAVDQIADYALVAGLTDPEKFPVGKGPLEVLKTLTTSVITPAVGEIWLAAGLHVRCFEFIDVKALLILQVGENFAVTLLGLASASFPPTGHAYAKATLQVRASYQASTGELAVLGQLTRDSYLLDPDCHLEGGFAVCTWVSPSPHAGDFVVCAGGYHPDYAKPGHYPDVPRIGFSWALGGGLSIVGECYAALTPSAFMLGARLDVDFHASVVHAWLHAQIDALIQWDPFSFEIDIGVRAGAELHIGFNPRIELGVDVTVWGPPTGGIATFHLPIISDVSVKFGASKPATLPWLDWSDFHTRVLGKQTTQVLATGGVLPEPPTPTAAAATTSPSVGEAEVKPWRVSAAGFSFISQAPTPVTTVSLVTPDGTTTPVSLHDRDPFSVRPMGTQPANATHTVTVKRNPTPAEAAAGVEPVVVDLLGGIDPWTAEAVYQDVPMSLWGPAPPSPGTRPATDTELLVGQAVGVRLTVPGPDPGDPLGPIVETVLEVDPIEVDPRPVYALSGSPDPDGPVPDRPGTVRTAIATGLLGTASTRAALDTALRKWGVAPPQPREGTLTDTAERVWSYLPYDPMTAPTRQARR
ncbi:DUF6603 domain-containing protein [Saccharothrix xinjiangensis]|uniref:DUF6603 domain-containing protein n=1 Tax=Saccharothrix xinjiangensis TaxID=204798 RepID=A0ABV9Y014_9PSEU